MGSWQSRAARTSSQPLSRCVCPPGVNLAGRALPLHAPQAYCLRLTPCAAASMRPCLCRRASPATPRRCKCLSLRLARFSASLGCAPPQHSPSAHAALHLQCWSCCLCVQSCTGRSLVCKGVWLACLTCLSGAPPQPLEQLTPLVLNPRLNPNKPLAIELINKVRPPVYMLCGKCVCLCRVCLHTQTLVNS